MLNRIRFLTGEMSLYKKRLLLKSLVIPHVDQLGPIALIFGDKECKKLFVLMRRASRVIFGLGPNVDDDFVNLLYNFDRRKVWLATIEKVLSNWESKNLKFNNESLKRALGLRFDIQKIKNSEIDLKLYGNE